MIEMYLETTLHVMQKTFNGINMLICSKNLNKRDNLLLDNDYMNKVSNVLVKFIKSCGKLIIVH